MKTLFLALIVTISAPVLANNCEAEAGAVLAGAQPGMEIQSFAEARAVVEACKTGKKPLRTKYAAPQIPVQLPAKPVLISCHKNGPITECVMN